MTSPHQVNAGHDDATGAEFVADLSHHEQAVEAFHDARHDSHLDDEQRIPQDQIAALQDQVAALKQQAQTAEALLAEEQAMNGASLDSAAQLLEHTRERIRIAEALQEQAQQQMGVIASGSAAVLRERDEAVQNWQYYRRRWPPYMAIALARRAVRFSRQKLEALANRRNTGFGIDSRVAVLSTGLPEAESSCTETHAAFASQTKQADRIVWPGSTDAGSESDVVQSWFAPDIPKLIMDSDIALVMHTQFYGPGPLWNPVFLEMVRAAFASDPKLAAIVYRGEPGEPKVHGQSHLYSTDADTVGSWDERHVAVAFRASLLAQVFSQANSAEQRNILPVVQRLLEQGCTVLVAPRSFPLDPVIGEQSRALVGSKLPTIEAGSSKPAPIRALYLTQWVECGGADKGILDLITHTNPEIVRFSLMTTSAANQSWASRVEGHVDEIIHLGDHLPIPADPRFSRFIAEYTRRRGIELIHIMHSFQGCDALKMIKEQCPGVRAIDQCHILEKPEFAGGGHPVYATEHAREYFDHRTVTNEWLKRHLVQNHNVPESDISVFYTCVDSQEEFNPERYTPGVFRQNLGLDDQCPIVVFLGRLHEQKRPELFAQVARRVTQQRPDLDAHFVMVGDGDLLLQVQAERQRMSNPSRLILAGEMGHSGPILRDADLMLMLSEREGLAYVSFEAMAMEVPQIFTDVNAQSELVTPDVGTLLDPSDVDALLDAAVEETIRLLDDRAARDRMGKAARARVVEHFTIEQMVHNYERLYSKLLNREMVPSSSR